MVSTRYFWHAAFIAVAAALDSSETIPVSFEIRALRSELAAVSREMAKTKQTQKDGLPSTKQPSEQASSIEIRALRSELVAVSREMAQVKQMLLQKDGLSSGNSTEQANAQASSNKINEKAKARERKPNLPKPDKAKKFTKIISIARGRADATEEKRKRKEAIEATWKREAAAYPCTRLQGSNNEPGRNQSRPCVDIELFRTRKRHPAALLIGNGPSANLVTAELAEDVERSFDVWAMNQFFVHNHLTPDFHHVEAKGFIEPFWRKLFDKRRRRRYKRRCTLLWGMHEFEFADVNPAQTCDANARNISGLKLDDCHTVCPSCLRRVLDYTEVTAQGSNPALAASAYAPFDHRFEILRTALYSLGSRATPLAWSGACIRLRRFCLRRPAPGLWQLPSVA